MHQSIASKQAAAFETANELQEAHARLLEALGEQLGEDGSPAAEVAALQRLEPNVVRFLERATAWVRDGSLRCREDMVDGLENAPEAFIGMLEGKNFGKLIVRV